MKSDHYRFAVVSLLSLSLLVLVSPAFAQPYVIGPGGGTPPPTGPGTTGGVPGTGGVNPNYKTAPLSAGQVVSIPIDVHNSTGAAIPNWAGVLVEVHLADPSEVDIVAVKIGGVPQPHPFPTSGGAGSTVATFPVFHPAAPFSGHHLLPSSGFPAITLDLVAKNTNPINNSDVDINLRFADIYHQPGYHTTITTLVHNPGPGTFHFTGPGSTSIPIVVQVPGSQNWQLPNSYRWLVPSSIDDLQQLHMTDGGHAANSNQPFPNGTPPPDGWDSKYYLPNNVNPETGHFIHLPAGNVHAVTTSIVTSLHVAGGPVSSIVGASSFWTATLTGIIGGSHIFAAPFLATANIGIEHIPEPAAPILLLAGIASLGFGFRARQNRRQLT